MPNQSRRQPLAASDPNAVRAHRRNRAISQERVQHEQRMDQIDDNEEDTIWALEDERREGRLREGRLGAEEHRQRVNRLLADMRALRMVDRALQDLIMASLSEQENVN